MPRRPRSLTAVVPILAASFWLAGCGGDEADPEELLSQKRADQLLAKLDAVEEAAAAGDCESTVTRARELRDQIGLLGGTPIKPLKDNLRDGAERLIEEARASCEEETDEPADSGPTEPVEPPTDPDPAETEEPPAEDPVTPPEDDTPEPEPDEPAPPEENPAPETPAPEPADPAEPAPTPTPTPTPAPSGPGPGGVGPGTEAGT